MCPSPTFTKRSRKQQQVLIEPPKILAASPVVAAASIAKVHPHVLSNKIAITATPAAKMAVPASSSSAEASADAAQHHPFVLRYRDELAKRRREYAASGCHPSRLPPIAETLNALALVHHRMAADPAGALRYHAEALGLLEECIVEFGERRRLEQERRRSAEHRPRQPQDASGSECSGEEGGSSSDGGAETDADAAAAAELAALRFDAAVTLSDVGDAHYTLKTYRQASIAYADALGRYRAAGISDGHPRVLSTRNRLDRLIFRGDADDGALVVDEGKGEAADGSRLLQAAFVAKGA